MVMINKKALERESEKKRIFLKHYEELDEIYTRMLEDEQEYHKRVIADGGSVEFEDGYYRVTLPDSWKNPQQ